NRQNYAEDDEPKHLSSLHISTSNEDFASHERGYKTLEEVTELVIRIPAEAQEIRDLKSYGNPRVSVQASGHQNERMQEYKKVKQIGQWEAPIARPEDGQGDGRRKYL